MYSPATRGRIRWRRALLATVVLPTTLAAQAAQRQAPVEVTSPKPPTPITADDKRLLGYELHITNFGARPLALRSVEVFSSLIATRPIATRSDSALRAAFQIGAAMRMADAHQSK